MPKIFLAYPFTDMPELLTSIERAANGLADVHTATSEWEAVHLLDKIDGQMRDADLVLFDVTTWNVNVAVEYGIARKAGYNHRLLFCTDARYEHFRRGRPSVFSDIAGVDSLHYVDFNTLERALRDYLPNALKQKHVISDLSVRPNLTLELGEKKIPGQGRVLEGTLRNHRAVAYDTRYRVDGIEREIPQFGGPLRLPNPIRLGTVAPQEAKALRHFIDREALGRNELSAPRVYFEYRDENGVDYRQQGWMRLQCDGRESWYSFDGLRAPEVIRDRNEILIPLVYA